MTETEKILDKLQKIKIHAESAQKIGSVEEAETFSRMLQQLLLKHKLEMTDLEFTKEEKAEPVDRYLVNWRDVRVRQARIDWIERLAGIVARAHFCRILIHPKSSRITLVGRKTDAEVAEFMIVTLVRAAEGLAESERGVYKREFIQRYPTYQEGNGEWVRIGREGFRRSFLQSFTLRLHKRFQEERASQEGSTSTALARFNRAEAAVEDFMKQFTGKAGILKRTTSWNAAGWERGKQAADAVSLKANAVKGGGVTGRKELR